MPDTQQDSERHVVAWTEIPVTDLAAAVDFYNAVFGFGATITDDPGSPNPSAMLSMEGVAGHLYPGTPAADGRGPTVHLNVDNLEAAAERWRQAGGKVLCDAISIPPGRFVYCLDPDGNSIGLFEAAGPT